MDLEPENFDLIVLGSGLGESLIASAAALGGKTVLLLDTQEWYGSQNATVPSAAWQLPPSNAQAPEGPHLPDGLEFVPIGPGAQGGRDVQFLRPREGCGDYDFTDCLVDQTPKIIYQAEDVVDTLVKSKAHNYLEFSLVDACYTYSGERLVAVPSTRADIFRDRSLSLADKRALSSFLQACLQPDGEDAASLGQDPFDERPLSALLHEYRLAPRLADMVMYGVAMCTHPQPPAPLAAASQPSAAAAREAAAVGGSRHLGPQLGAPNGPAAGAQHLGPDVGLPNGTRPEAGPRHPEPAPGQVNATWPASAAHADGNGAGQGPGGPGPAAAAVSAALPRVMSSAEGREALRLYLRSMGRFSGSTSSGGAFMFPSYGSGALCEAFVRCAAVHGAVTVLRWPLAGLAMQEVGEGGIARVAGVVTAHGQLLRCGAVVAGEGYLRPLLEAALVPLAPRQLVSRAVVMMDGSLQPGKSTLALALPPGACRTPEGGVQRGVVQGLQLSAANRVVACERFLLHLAAFGPLAGGASNDALYAAQQEVHGALNALVRVGELQLCTRAHGTASGEGPDPCPNGTCTHLDGGPMAERSAAASQASTSAPGGAAGAGGAGATGQGAERGVAEAGPEASGQHIEQPPRVEGQTGWDCRPKALAVLVFHMELPGDVESVDVGAGETGSGVGPRSGMHEGVGAHSLQPASESNHVQPGAVSGWRGAGVLPANVAVCPSSGGLLVGWGDLVARCGKTFRKVLPGVPWWPEVESAAAIGASADEGEVEALDELSAALEHLG